MTTLVALMVDDETTFGLAAWHRSIPLLARKGFVVTHVGVVPAGLKKYRGAALLLWYLRTFGLWNTALLGAFSLLERRRRANREPRTWEEVSCHHGLVLRRFRSPNSPEAQAFLRGSECDILFIHVPFILNRETLSIPKIGTINKHASVLPSCKGLFPYLWAKSFGEPLGVSFHEVTGDVDGGRILAQSLCNENGKTGTMLGFYVWVYRQYAELAAEAAVRLRAGKEVPAPAAVDSCYYGLPSRRDRIGFERAGGRIARIRDLKLTLSSGPAESQPQREAAEPVLHTLVLRKTADAARGSGGRLLQMPAPPQRLQGSASAR